uniref:Uncharacterized protein n=1 Tax=Anopheles coluzzii TaxID=1518534 RepID=A0A8W7NXR0_ANOCL
MDYLESLYTPMDGQPGQQHAIKFVQRRKHPDYSEKHHRQHAVAEHARHPGHCHVRFNRVTHQPDEAVHREHGYGGQPVDVAELCFAVRDREARSQRQTERDRSGQVRLLEQVHRAIHEQAGALERVQHRGRLLHDAPWIDFQLIQQRRLVELGRLEAHPRAGRSANPDAIVPVRRCEDGRALAVVGLLLHHPVRVRAGHAVRRGRLIAVRPVHRLGRIVPVHGVVRVERLKVEHLRFVAEAVVHVLRLAARISPELLLVGAARHPLAVWAV